MYVVEVVTQISCKDSIYFMRTCSKLLSRKTVLHAGYWEMKTYRYKIQSYLFIMLCHEIVSFWVNLIIYTLYRVIFALYFFALLHMNSPTIIFKEGYTYNLMHWNSPSFQFTCGQWGQTGPKIKRWWVFSCIQHCVNSCFTTVSK